MRGRIVITVGLLVLTSLLVACTSQPAAQAPAGDIPATLSASGDVARGQALFTERGCGACHYTNTDQLVGPGLAGSLSNAGPAHPAGIDYAGNLPNGQPRTEENIAAWIRSGGQGQIGLMSAQAVSDEEMPHLLAYLRTLTR